MKYMVLESIRNQNQDLLREQFAADVLAGFSADVKFLPCKYFYDAEGSRLFERIMELDEYYLTRCEFAILDSAGPDIARLLQGKPVEIIELGAGDGRKTKALLRHLCDAGVDLSYVPVDISEAAVAKLVDSLRATWPGLRAQGIVGEYVDSIRYLESVSDRRKLVLFLGSNIGNFDPAAAQVFLRTIRRHLNHDDLLLIGFDLKKDLRVLTQAYDDASGVTREFNLNILRRINAELDGHFDPARFTHHALYNPVRGAMESYLVSMRAQIVDIAGLRMHVRFAPWEAIHLEYSWKYLPDDIADMAVATGYGMAAQWLDRRGYFADSLWTVRKA